MANVNIEKVLIEFLKVNKSVGFSVHGDKPKNTPDAYVLVDRTGGPREHKVQDRAELLVEVYHKDSRVAASDEAYRIADMLPFMLEIEPVMKVDVTSVVKLDDLVGQFNRYQIYVDVYYRRGDFFGTIEYPVIGQGGILSIVAGTGIEIDDSDPLNPIINALAQPQEYTEFVFNSSGDQEGNRYNDWTDLFAAVPEQRIKVLIQFEQDEVWDVPGEYDMTRISFSGNGNLFVSGAAIEILIQDGVTFSSIDGFTITNGIFFHSQSHEPLAIIESGTPTAKANYLAAFATDYAEIFKTRIAGSLNLNLVPGGAIANISAFTGVGYEVVNLENSSGEGFQVRFGGFGSGVMNNTVRGTDPQFIIIKEDIGYMETDTVGIPGLGNLESTHENYTGGDIGRLTLVKASQIDMSAVEGLVSTQVQAAIEELAARPTGVPDVAYTEIDMTGKIFNFLSGQYLDMGTDGFANLRWRRIGRQVEGYFASRWAANCEYGSFVFLPTDLPYFPRTPLGAEVGMFCYLQVGESSPGADDGQLLPLGSVCTDVGLGDPIIMLVQLSGALGDGGLDNIFLSNGNPIDLTGREFSVYGRIIYECAEEAGNTISIDGDFTNEAIQGEEYSSTLPIITTSPDQYPITAEFGGGTPPTGYSVSIDGEEITIAGNTGDIGTFTFQVVLTDVDGIEYTKAVTIEVASGTPLTINIPGNVYSATNGEILKIRTQAADIEIGSSKYHVEIGDFIQYSGTGGTNGGWQYMSYN